MLYSFAGGSDGYWPESGLVADSAGNFYGTTANGGANGFGTVYELSPGGVKTILYAFAGYYNGDGQTPSSGLVRDAVGNLYGTTSGGGTSGNCYPTGCGTVYRINAGGGETILYSFTDTPDGKEPAGNLLLAGGLLYGATQFGGSFGDGTIFEVATTSSFKSTVWNFFCSTSDGCLPTGALVTDSAGYLYGMTNSGGKYNQGISFKLTPTGVETVLNNFGTDGEQPFGGLIFGKGGALFGTTAWGGANGEGAVVKVTP